MSSSDIVVGDEAVCIVSAIFVSGGLVICFIVNVSVSRPYQLGKNCNMEAPSTNSWRSTLGDPAAEYLIHPRILPPILQLHRASCRK